MADREFWADRNTEESNLTANMLAEHESELEYLERETKRLFDEIFAKPTVTWTDYNKVGCMIDRLESSDQNFTRLTELSKRKLDDYKARGTLVGGSASAAAKEQAGQSSVDVKEATDEGKKQDEAAAVVQEEGAQATDEAKKQDEAAGVVQEEGDQVAAEAKKKDDQDALAELEKRRDKLDVEFSYNLSVMRMMRMDFGF